MGGSDGLALAQVLCARLCHDLGGPVGSLVTATEIGGTEAEALARDSVETLRRRLHLFRLLAGSAGEMSRAALEDACEGMLAHGRVRLDVSGCADRDVPAAIVPALLAAILVAAEALPRGGAVVLAGDAAADILLLVVGRDAAWPAAALALAAGRDLPALTPRTVLAQYLRDAAAQAGMTVQLAMAPGEGTALRLAMAS